MEKLKMKNLKLNYHLTEVCNFGCKFCFAKYKHRCRLSFDEMETIVKKTADCGFFSGINFAGGEPFLVKRLPELIKIAKDKQLETSVITNGSFLTTEMLDSILPFLDCIGISVHSVSDKIKIKTGSCSKTNEVLSNERLLEICRYIRRKSNCKIKINTVVNSLNKTEIISDFIKNLGIDRWKILRCQSFGCNTEMLVTDDEWNIFCERNYGLKGSVFENNMKDTYIMVNPSGFMIKENPDKNGYEEIGNVFDNEIQQLLNKHPLHIDEYRLRYSA